MFKNSSFYIFQMLHIQTYVFLIIRRKNPHKIYRIFKYIFLLCTLKIIQMNVRSSFIPNFQSSEATVMSCRSCVWWCKSATQITPTRQMSYGHPMTQRYSDPKRNDQATGNMEESPKHTTTGRLRAVCHHLSDKLEQARWQRVAVANGKEHLGGARGLQGVETGSADHRCSLAFSGEDHNAYTSLEQGSPWNLLSIVPRISHKALLLLSITWGWSMDMASPGEKIQL